MWVMALSLALLTFHGCVESAFAGDEEVSVVDYGVGIWNVAGRGNHRALVKVDRDGDAVWVRIPWRRRDPNPEEKGIRVYDAQTGNRITNVVVVALNQDFGELAFQPTSGAGIYEVYYLPYQPPKDPIPGSWWREWYLKPEETADPEWLKRNGLTFEHLKSGAHRDKLPQAKVIAIQARTEFDRFDPMEVIATREEVSQLLAKYPNRSYLVFPEDRRFTIRMFEHLPYRWVGAKDRGHGTGNGEEGNEKFVGQAQPNEFYVFQLGIFAARKPITDLQLEFSELKGSDSKNIPASSFRCFNLSGTGWLGRPMGKPFSVAVGRVRPLWIGVQVPKNAKGKYVGTIKVKPKGLEETIVTVELKVDGEVLGDRGDSDNWRLSRLRWLDSTLGLEDKVVPPFTPLKFRGNAIECLGRQVRFGALGLPESIQSNGREILAAPVGFVVETESEQINLKPSRRKWLKGNEAVAEWETKATSDAINLTVRTKMEFDGCIMHTKGI